MIFLHNLLVHTMHCFILCKLLYINVFFTSLLLCIPFSHLCNLHLLFCTLCPLHIP
jgi:hypothetical protein